MWKQQNSILCIDSEDSFFIKSHIMMSIFYKIIIQNLLFFYHYHYYLFHTDTSFLTCF